MQFAKLLLAATACAVASAAKFGMTGSQFVGVTVGSTFNISWYDGVGPYTVLLKNGEANVLKTYSTIGSGLTGTSIAWVIPTTLPEDTYAFEIDDASASPINYSVRFMITGGPALSSSSTASSTSSASTGSSASTATTSASTATASNSTSSITSGSRTSTATSSKTGTSTSSTSTATTGSVSSAAGVASPLAFVLLAFAAILTLN